MTERDREEVLDNPEWSEADIKTGRHLSDVTPKLAGRIARILGRPMRGAKAKPMTAPARKPLRGQRG